MDRGMVSEENLEFLRARNAHYLVGTPKVQLRHFAQSLLEEKKWARERAALVTLGPRPAQYAAATGNGLKSIHRAHHLDQASFSPRQR
jgi:hypothetical protein